MRISSRNLRGMRPNSETLPLHDPMDKFTTVFPSVRLRRPRSAAILAGRRPLCVMSTEESRGEFAFIDWLRRRTPAAGRVLIGPGDDAALLDWSGGAGCIATTDMLLEGSCFRAGGGGAAARRPQGDGREPERHRGDGRPAGRGAGQRGPAAPRRPRPGGGAVSRDARDRRRLRHADRRRRHQQLGRPARHQRDAAGRGDASAAWFDGTGRGRATG